MILLLFQLHRAEHHQHFSSPLLPKSTTVIVIVGPSTVKQQVVASFIFVKCRFHLSLWMPLMLAVSVFTACPRRLSSPPISSFSSLPIYCYFKSLPPVYFGPYKFCKLPMNFIIFAHKFLIIIIIYIFFLLSSSSSFILLL